MKPSATILAIVIAISLGWCTFIRAQDAAPISPWLIGAEGTVGASFEQSRVGPFDGLTGIAWAGGLVVQRRWGDADLAHGPSLTLHYLNRSFNASVVGEPLPALDSNGNVHAQSIEDRFELTASYVVGAVNYSVIVGDLEVRAGVGMSAAVSGSGKRYRTGPDGWLNWFDPGPFPGDYEVVGNDLIIDRYDRSDLVQQQYFVQASITYAFRWESVQVTLGPHYRHKFNATLIGSTGSTWIGDLSFMVGVGFEL
jgi:hypothetical protein